MKEKLMKLFHKIQIIFNINKGKEILFFQIFTFLFVGGLAFIIDYIVLICCKEVLNINLLLSAAFAFSISVIFNYLLSVKIVFDVDKEKSKKRNFVIFIIFSIIGLGLTELIMWFGVSFFDITYLIVKIIATGIVMVFNFITRKIFLERKK